MSRWLNCDRKLLSPSPLQFIFATFTFLPFKSLLILLTYTYRVKDLETRSHLKAYKWKEFLFDEDAEGIKYLIKFNKNIYSNILLVNNICMYIYEVKAVFGDVMSFKSMQVENNYLEKIKKKQIN